MFSYEISFPDTKVDQSIKSMVEEQLVKLEHFHERIIFCHVFVRFPNQTRTKKFCHINILLKIPGKEIVVTREPEKNYDHTDISIAIHDAFDTLVRKLEDTRRTRKSMHKISSGSVHGTIKSFDPNTGYGFIEADGREIYFHQNSLVDGHVTRLKEGLNVRFHEESGEEGAQASSFSLMRDAS